MFPERMEQWNRFVFQEMLEKYAVSEKALMIEKDSGKADVDRLTDEDDAKMYDCDYLDDWDCI